MTGNPRPDLPEDVQEPMPHGPPGGTPVDRSGQVPADAPAPDAPAADVPAAGVPAAGVPAGAAHDDLEHDDELEHEETVYEIGPGDRRQGPGRAVLSAVKEAAIVVGMALVLSLVVKTWLMQAFYIPSGSMENTLVNGDRVIVSKLTPGPFALQRGDVVVFEDPANWLGEPVPVQRGPVGAAVHNTLTFVGLLPTDEGNHLIKRVIGLPGDHVVCCDDQHRITVNGAPLNEPYIKPGDEPSRQEFDITVPAGRVWVMGDHRSDSSDSRFHDNGDGGKTGSVPESKIVGRALSVVWPVADWSWLSRPTATFAKVPPPQTTASGH
ncbi:signal peptidase I [Oryzihumus leptocrescens]|uniref:signal peptidase I n=1 Tax=Oryzihumus leptocrescens TaxID=297536 RepID=UPI00319E7093